MQVSRYQMNNVLECFGRKLRRMRKNEKPAQGAPPKSTDEPALSAESSRQATMAKISRQVLEKVTDVAALSLSREKASPGSPSFEEEAAASGEPTAAEFTFNVIDVIDRKRTGRLALGSPTALIRRLDPATEKPTASKTESWV